MIGVSHDLTIANETTDQPDSSSQYSRYHQHGVPVVERPADPVSQGILNPNIEHRAINFFIKNFAFPNEYRTTADGFLNAIVNLYQQEREGSLLQAVTHAVSLATIGSRLAYRDVAELGRQQYVQALSATQNALRGPAVATSDAVLTTVVLLSLYESATGAGSSLEAWGRHLDGAVAIVKARGQKHLTTARDRCLFRAIRTQMLSFSMQTQRQMPSIPGPRGWMSEMSDGDDEHIYNFLKIAMEVTNLWSHAKRPLTIPKSANNMKEVQTLLAQAQALQWKRMKWDRRLPKEWSYQSTAVMTGKVNEDNVEEVEAWPDPKHTYSNVHIASTMNNHRVCAIAYAGIIKDSTKWLRPTNHLQDPDYRSAICRIQYLVDGVCYSFLISCPDSGWTRKITPATSIPQRWFHGRLRAVATRMSLQPANTFSVVNQRALERLCARMDLPPQEQAEPIVFNVPTSIPRVTINAWS